MNNKMLNPKSKIRALAMAMILAIVSATAALAAAGAFDPTFDGDGKAILNLGGDDSIQAMVLQPDGKIIVAGYTNNPPIAGYDFALARYNSDGSLDASFDGDGIVTTDILALDNKAMAVALQPLDGKIVVGGDVCFSATDCDFALTRYHSNGSLDTSFDGDGIVTTDFDWMSDEIRGVAIQTDGKIVVVGYTGDYAMYSAYGLARYHSDGSLDTSFDVDGKAEAHIGWLDYPRAILIQPDGKILVAGLSDTEALFGEDYISLARLNTDGSYDTSFSGNGRVTIDFPPHSGGTALALQTNGKIIVAGHTGYPRDFALARLNPDGTQDSLFSGDGKLATDLGGNDNVFAIALQPDGKILLAGISDASGANDFVLARYHREGFLDTSFSGDGIVRVSLGADDGAYAAAVQPDGNILAAGSANENFALARFEGGGLGYASLKAHDGWILESSETSNVGGTMNSTATTLNIGDGEGDKQYRALISFTTFLPNGATITKATLNIKAAGALVGNNNPFTWSNGLKVDICIGSFDSPGLQLNDFNFNNTANCRLNAGTFTPTSTAGWYSADLVAAAWRKINVDGSTQFRLRFTKDDNDDGAPDFWRFVSGDHPNPNYRPTLIIEYDIP